jgi:type I restriction enzyme M protein
MARPSVTEDRRAFLNSLRRIGSTIGNKSFREHLGWKEDRYWRVHALLLEAGLIERGRGRGGSVTAAPR